MTQATQSQAESKADYNNKAVKHAARLRQLAGGSGQ